MKHVITFTAPIVLGANNYVVEFECSYYGKRPDYNSKIFIKKILLNGSGIPFNYAPDKRDIIRHCNKYAIENYMKN